MNTVKFTATKLNGTGKQGLLTPDENGYYTMPIGGLNAFNSVGEYYTLEGAKQLFEQSNIFMRRVSNGCLKGEVGHPKKIPGMTMDDYMHRILSIDEKNICCHFKEIWLDESYGRNNPQFKNPSLVAIMAKIKPAGPQGDHLQKEFENPSENVCFSIRALTRDYYQRGQTYRVLQQIITFDKVLEPGLANATKWSSPSLESLEDRVITRKNIEKVIAVSLNTVATEDSRIIAQESLKIFSEIPKLPIYSNW